MNEVTAIQASEQFGIGVRKVRELRGLSQNDLARRLGTDEKEIQSLEEGVLFFEAGGGYPQKVADALDVPLEIVVMVGADLSSLSEGDRMIAEKLIDLAVKLIQQEPLE